MMKATHTDYKHPRHLRVEGCEGHRFFDGPCSVGVLCVAPSSALYAKLNRPGLPSLKKPAQSKQDIAYEILVGKRT